MKILVIGGGVMGLTCAWRLAETGARVELVEQRTCGAGATLAALGALWPASPLVRGEMQERHRESLWGFEGFVLELVEKSGRDVRFRRLGRVEMMNSAKAAARAREEAEAACARWPQFGEGRVMEFVEEGALAELQPGAVRLGFGALLCRVTAQVVVGELVAALKEVCLRAGVEIFEGTTVDRIESDAMGCVAMGESGRRFGSESILVATGAWTRQHRDGDPVIVPAKGQGIAIERPVGVELPRILKSGPTYLIPWDGEILVGSTTEPGAGFDETPTDEARALLLKNAAAMIPALQSAKVLRHWAGLRPMNAAKGHAPLMGPHASLANVFVCTGHYKTGIGMAPFAGRRMCELILSKPLR